MSTKIVAALGAVLVACGSSKPKEPTPLVEHTAAAASTDTARTHGEAAAPPTEGELRGNMWGDSIGESPGDAEPETAPPPPRGAPPAWLTEPMPAYQAGDAVVFVPKDCDERLYIDLRAVVGPDSHELTRLIDQGSHAAGVASHAARVKRVVDMFREAGASPFDSWRELVLCDRGGHATVAIGLATLRPVEMTVVMQNIRAALGNAPGSIVREGATSMLIVKDGDIVAQPAPHVFLLGKTRESLAEAIARKEGAGGFAAARGHLIHGEVRDVHAAVKDRRGTLEVRIAAPLPRQVRTDAEKQQFTKGLLGKLAEAADSMKGGKLEVLGERIRAAKIAIEPGVFRVDGSISRASLLTMLRSLNGDDFVRMLETLP
jgi:hypothetical protein